MSVTPSASAGIVKNENKYRLQGGLFLATVTAVSAVFGFSRTVMNAKKHDAKMYDKVVTTNPAAMEAGASLALRALGWGTLYAVLGTGVVSFSIWKLSGAKNMIEFREKMQKTFPRVPRNNPPTSRTEFDGLSDLMNYLTVWRKEP